VESGQKGTILFRQGDNKNEFVYLLSGNVSLQAGDVEMDVIEGGTEASRFALAHQIPRKVNAIAKSKIQFVRIDSNLIYSQSEEKKQPSSGYEVSDLPGESSNDWMTELLKSPIFERLPASNLQKVIMGLEEVPVIEGEEIFRQGDTGDYYYIIKSGQCTLTRKPNAHAKEITLAKLKTCDCFGEDALISNQPRNVSITMLTPGVVLRLKKEKFLTLIKEPVISFINHNLLDDALEKGSILVDLRSPDDYEKFHLPDSKNIPFFSLRMQIHNFSADIKPILICEDGNTSQAAAFLLIREGFNAEVLRGGLNSFPEHSTKSTDTPTKYSSKSEQPSADNSLAKQTEQSVTPEKKIHSTENNDAQKQLEQSLTQLKKDSETQINQLRDKLNQSNESNRSLTQDIEALKQKIVKVTSTQQSIESNKIAKLEETIQSFEETLKQKDERYHNDLEKASEKINYFKEEGNRLVEKHSEATSKLDQEIANLTHKIKEQAANQRSTESRKLVELEATIQTLEQTLKQNEATHYKNLKLESDKTKQFELKGKQLAQQFATTQSGLEKEITDLQDQLKSIEKQTSFHKAEDFQKISDLESNNKTLEKTLEQKDNLYRKNQNAASEKITQLEQAAKQLTERYSDSLSSLKKTIASLEDQVRETKVEAKAKQTDDSEKIGELESTKTSLEETLEQKDELYRKNQIAASERISQLEQEITLLKTQLSKSEEQASIASEKIENLESSNRSLEQTLERKETQYQKDVTTTSQKLDQFDEDRKQLIHQHAESISGLEKDIQNLKAQLKENEEIASKKESANALEKQGLEEIIKSLEQTLKQKDKEYYQDLTKSSEKITQLAHDRTESIQQHAEATSRLEQEITHLKEKLASAGSKENRSNESGKLLKTKEADYKKQISALKNKNDSLQIDLTQSSEDIKALESNLINLQEDNATLHSRLERVQDGEEQDAQYVETIKNFQQRVSELEEQIAATQHDKEIQVKSLKQKSTELESIVKNLVDNAKQNSGSEDVASLKTELDMIRTHANSDFEAMVEQLKTAQTQAEQFKKALRQEKRRVAQLESELDQPLTVSADFTATDEDIFSTEDSDSNPQSNRAKKKTSKKLAFWKN